MELTASDFGYGINPNGGLKRETSITVIDDNTREFLPTNIISVNLDFNDFYTTPGTGEIALNLTNKIDGTLSYNASTRKIGINTTASQTFGKITTGTMRKWRYW